MTRTEDSREIALDILMEILEREGLSHQVLRQALSKYQYLDKAERSFITRLSEGTVEYLPQIDHVLGTCSSVKVHKMKPVIRTILRMSVYQLLYMDRVPDAAVCNEAVKLAMRRKFAGLKGFVNGVLRTAARRKDEWVFEDGALACCLPQWLYDRCASEYGSETVRRMAESFLESRRLSVRCNVSRAPKEEIIKSLRSQGVTVEESDLSPAVLYLRDYDYLERLEAFEEGLIQVQDVSSVLAGHAAAVESGDRVIDVCGAPGGKSLHVADLLKGTGHVEVRDISDYKVGLIEENIARAGFQNMEARVWDALELDPAAVESADIVLADLPCSGLGIIGRKPEIKYRVTPEQIKSLAKLQREILSVVWQYVKPGGQLIYSTCTISPEENQNNVKWFLENFPFEPTGLSGRLPETLDTGSFKEGWVQLLPGRYPGDGFFIAALRRNDG